MNEAARLAQQVAAMKYELTIALYLAIVVFVVVLGVGLALCKRMHIAEMEVLHFRQEKAIAEGRVKVDSWQNRVSAPLPIIPDVDGDLLPAGVRIHGASSH